MNADTITGVFIRTLDVLFLNNPVRTAIGVVVGVVLWGFSRAFSTMIEEVMGLDLSLVPWIAWLALGVLGVSLKGSPVKTRLPEDIEILFDLLEKAEKAGISKFEQRQHFRRILEKYTDNVALNQKRQKELE
jgi:hypothetical protein